MGLRACTTLFETADAVLVSDLEATGGEKILEDIERGHDENV